MSLAADPVRYEPEQEVRLAVVMYGGVSLAIYMYGVAEELWRLVRATAPNYPDHSDTAASGLAYPEPESTESVYRELGQILPADGSVVSGARIRTRFVVDVISGTSAGGINGICLAKALVNQTSLTPLKAVWVDDGDIGVLIDDEESTRLHGDDGSWAVVEELVRTGPPRSLLNGRRMLYRLVEALNAMNPPAGRFDSPLVEELDLFVTATDLEGRDTALQLELGVVHEKRHAHRSHFRYAPHESRSDFTAQDSGFLAYAARSTSAFPFAFEPMVLSTLRQDLDPDWKRFYAGYTGAEPEFPRRPFSDGGILDNKPFSYAIETIGRRQTSLPVQRKLIFIEPDPATRAEPKSDVWNAIETVQAAALGIPTVETIREDIQQILARNRIVGRVRDLSSFVHRDAEARGTLIALAREQPNEEWAAQTLDDTILGRSADGGQRPGWDLSYGTYHRMKVRGLADHLAAMVVRAATAFDHDSDEAYAVTFLVRAWKEDRYPEPPVPGRSGENAFLIDFDIPYRIRRIGFVLQKLRDITSPDGNLVSRTFEASPLTARSLPDDVDAPGVIADFRSGLHEIRRLLQDLEQGFTAPDGPFAEIGEALDLSSDDLIAILRTGDDEAMLERARRLLSAERGEAFTRLTDFIRDLFTQTAGEARTRVELLLGRHTAERGVPEQGDLRATLQDLLRFYYDAFEAYDLVLYPIQYGTPFGEGHLVDVARISPLDATRPDVPAAARKLKGVAMHHFAAFLDEGWRRNDIAWGRLNAAEGLIRMLLPDQPERADELIDRAQAQILAEYESELAALDDRDASWSWYQAATTPDEVRTRKAMTRAAGVIGPLVQAILDERGNPQRQLLNALATQQAGPTARAATGGSAAFAWKLVRRALDPGRNGFVAAGNVLLALLPVPLLILVAFIGIEFLASDAVPDRFVVNVFILLASLLALAIGLVAWGVRRLRKAVFSRVYDEVFEPKPEAAASSS